MKSNNVSRYKDEINNKLTVAKTIIEEMIDLVETNESWKTLHLKTEDAIGQLKRATKLLAEHHVAVCIFDKHKHRNTRFEETQTKEIIKTYGYLR
jgi:hypothetical protein